MKKQFGHKLFRRLSTALLSTVGLMLIGSSVQAQSVLNSEQTAQIQQKAEKWVQALGLKEPAKVGEVTSVVKTHLTAVYAWNKTHLFTEVPAGVNPRTGDKLTELDRRMIAQSAMPAAVHEALMSGLRKYLTPVQVEQVLDGYTVGKVAFTLKGYQAIIPDLTKQETEVILTNLKEAREMAVDYKSMKSISAVFEIYKTKNEKYLNEHGRNWHQLFKNYVNKVKAEKAAAAKSNK